MLRGLIFFILLAFPIAEIWMLVKLGQQYGIWLLVYLVVIGYLGLRLLRTEKHLMTGKMMQTLGAGGNPVKTMLGSARNMIAGVLLLIPGVITDAIAVILLLIPIQQSGVRDPSQSPFRGAAQAANDDVIEGEYVHVREDLEKK